ncbi:hypothetical protein BC941DRAFT_205959 [Chlamydoabsidia padenii]|nr:hypothetical protein BC941DRAFT_205959 [Chlamydoabsidia padenii]
MAAATMLDILGDTLKSISFDFPPYHLTDFDDSLGGAWFVSPTQHALELLVLVPIFTGLTLFFGNRAFGKHTEAYRLMKSTHKVPKATVMERIFVALLIGSFGITCAHKTPCHASALLLIIVMLWPFKQNPLIPRLLLNTYYYTLWGAILALIFPDLRDHDMLGEVFNFFLEHSLILIVPLYLISHPRYVTIPPSVDMALFSFFLYAFYHSPILHVFSLWSGYNLNYSLVPPALGFLIETGPGYRYIMYTAALVNMFWTRYLLMDGYHKLIQWTRQQRKLKAC